MILLTNLLPSLSCGWTVQGTHPNDIVRVTLIKEVIPLQFHTYCCGYFVCLFVCFLTVFSLSYLRCHILGHGELSSKSSLLAEPTYLVSPMGMTLVKPWSSFPPLNVEHVCPWPRPQKKKKIIMKTGTVINKDDLNHLVPLVDEGGPNSAPIYLTTFQGVSILLISLGALEDAAGGMVVHTGWQVWEMRGHKSVDQASQISLLMEQLFKNKNFSLSLKPPALSCHHRKPAPKSSETTDINNESPPLLEQSVRKMESLLQNLTHFFYVNNLVRGLSADQPFLHQMILGNPVQSSMITSTSGY